jgi:hypothetical protein
VVLFGERTFASKYPDLGWNRLVIRYQGERILLASTDQVVGEVDRILRYLEVNDSRSLIELLVQTSCIEGAMGPIAGRFTDLKSRMPDLADRLDRLAALVDSMLINALIGEFLIANHSVEHVDQIAVSMRTSFSTWEWFALGPMTRAGRESLLRHEIEWVQLARRHPSPTDFIVTAKRIRSEYQALRTWMPNEVLARMVMGAILTVLESTAKCQVRLQVMTAELRGLPWPIDPYDTTGKPLRRLERDGALVGAYTVYEDGIDDSGDKQKDRYFPLYGPLEPPLNPGP